MRNSFDVRIVLACLLSAVCGEIASADVVLLPKELRVTIANVAADGDHVGQESTPIAPGLLSYESDVYNYILHENRTNAIADARLSSFRSTSSMSGQGGAFGQIYGIVTNGTIDASSVTEFHFAVPDCIGYAYSSALGVNPDRNIGKGLFQFVIYDGATLHRESLVEQFASGGGAGEFVSGDGQLSPGNYLVRGRSETGIVFLPGTSTAPAYSWALYFHPCVSNVISQHPVGGPVDLGATAVLSVTAGSGAAAVGSGAGRGGVSSASSPGLTYQWRHAGVDLVDDGRITGATTATLSIANVQVDDAGGYVVRVSDGITEQTSSLATLTLPEPDAAALLTAGVVALVALGRRRRSPVAVL
ncbi:MAG: hypothetical protein U0900_06040 [Myxococcota bacterium]